MNYRFFTITCFLLSSVITGCSSNNDINLIISDISGPCPGNYACAIPEGCHYAKEGETVEITVPDHVVTVDNQVYRFSVKASGDTGIKYLWSIYPESAGTLSEWYIDNPKTYFHPSNPDEITEMTIQVEVSSDNYGPIIKKKRYVLDSSKKGQVYDNLKYYWIVTNPELGYISDLYSKTTYLHLNEVEHDSLLVVHCEISSGDCVAGYYQDIIEIKNIR